jgi:tetratricopeptide (TPR) repeat protein
MTGLLFAAGLTSCNDWFDLHPQSETILEDFWQDENDVKSMVAACYRAMNEPAFMERLLVWGEIRSDNILKGGSQNTDIDRILELTLNATNPYTSWDDFYRLINYCNTVIYYAPTVLEKDPNFTPGQLRSYLAEVKGIRALCYFTLVRTFRDIPFHTQPVFDDSQTFEMKQSDPDEIIRYLIDDLKEIENSAMLESVQAAYDKGRITQKAIQALIADMALWINDYQTCIDYCDKVIESNPLIKLELSQDFSYSVFLTGLSDESIFELQFSATLPNYAVQEMYGQNTSRSGVNTYKVSSFDFSKTGLFGEFDRRGKDFLIPYEENALFRIVKYVGYRYRVSPSGVVSRSDYLFTISSSLWTFYRLPDIYLMKAEALVEQGGQEKLEEAFELVRKTYERANPDLEEGSFTFASYNSPEAMRDLVFDERQREFLFEGKRYFDLLRRIKRDGTPGNVVPRYLIRKYEAQGLEAVTVRSKINDKDAIYMPINETELKNNTLLVQNPFYVLSSDITKN